MERDSLMQRQELLIVAACVGAHANLSNKDTNAGFRVKDVRFLLELCRNWVHEPPEAEPQHTQINRYLDWLTKEGYARKLSRKRPPLFRLTRVGLLELVTRMVSGNPLPTHKHFFFLYYFIKSYKTRLIELIKAEGAQFPPGLRIELEALLDERPILERALAESKRELEKLNTRIHGAEQTVAMTTASIRQKMPIQEIIAMAEERFPYELNSQRPLRELMESLPPEVRPWELQYGNQYRVELMWKPARALLKSYITSLETLSKQASSSSEHAR